jgi:hypothetical protein
VNNTQFDARTPLANDSDNDLLITSAGCADNYVPAQRSRTYSRLFGLVGALFEDDLTRCRECGCGYGNGRI